jgi:hypothetical protein
MEALKVAEEILKLLGDKSDQEKALILSLVRMTLSKGDPNNMFCSRY